MVFGKMLDTREKREERERERERERGRDRIVATACGREERAGEEVKERKPRWTSEAFERDKKGRERKKERERERERFARWRGGKVIRMD